MLTVTETAGAHLAATLKESEAPEGTAVRFVDKGGGAIALRQDSVREGDATFQHEGRTVLLLDAQMAELLAEKALDVVNGKLALRHPEVGE